MRSDRIGKKVLAGCMVLTGMALVIVVGCGPGDTPATLQPGTGENALDGAVISDDGNTLTFTVSEDGGSLEAVEIDTPEGAERVEFDDAVEAGGVAIPREIDTAAGNSFAFDRDTNSAGVTTTLPFQSTPTTFDVNLDSNPFELNARSAQQDGGNCEAVRDSIDQFCSFFQESAESKKEDLISVATEIALEQSPDSLDAFVPGVVSDVINDLFNTLDVVCNGWSQMRAGTETTAEVDPCESL